MREVGIRGISLDLCIVSFQRLWSLICEVVVFEGLGRVLGLGRGAKRLLMVFGFLGRVSGLL